MQSLLLRLSCVQAGEYEEWVSVTYADANKAGLLRAHHPECALELSC